jgi:DNA-binding CsgD family transcriptional regulator
VLIGRDGECTQLRKILADSLNGRPRIVALRGDPGIGKTRLLEYCVAVGEEFRVIRIQGHEAEREIPYAALSMLVGPLIAEAVDLPDVQAAALEGALNLGPAVHGDRMGVAAATLAVLAAAADRKPLLLAVDDVHLIDPPTLETLFFVLRRTQGERLAAVMTARSESDVSPVVAQWLDPIDQIWLEGLDLESARRLTAHCGALPAAVWTASGGNPLALLEMTAPNSAVFLDEPMQLPARLLRAYGRRLTGLSAATRDALLLLAVAGRATDILGDALAHRGLSRSDLEPAENGGLVVAESGAVLFAHPLVCSAVYHSASPAMKRSAHQTMVAAYDGRVAPGAAERRAFHLAAATSGPDEVVAGHLEDAAKGAAARYSHTTAAALFEKSALLSPPGASRTRRIIDAALAGQAAGTLDAAGPLLDLAISETDDEDLRIAAMHLQCRIQMWSGRPAQARDQLLDLADRTEGRYREWSAVMRSQAAIVSIALGEQRMAIGMAGRAAEITGHLPDQLVLPVLVAHAVTQAINGETASARALLERCAPHLPGCDPLSIDQLLVLAALAYALVGEIATARHWLETSVRKTRSAQAAGLLPFQLSWLTLVCWLEGDWVGALAHGHAAVQIAKETGWATELPNCLVALATVEATLGREEEAREHVALAARLGAEQSGARIFAAHAARVSGLLELGAGHPVEAAELLGVAAEFALAGRMGDSVLFNWAGDLTESLVRSGRAEPAARAYRSVVREAEQTGRPAELAIAARCRGLLAGSLDDGRSAFVEALGWHEQAGQPFDHARTQLCFGEFLRRRRLRTEAREQLGAALATFSRLGAVAWVRRAESELRATGLTSRKRTPSATEQLTPQELQVAVVVADGVTNAEAAARLFLSAKTIEFHLSNVYRKLGIRSRSELVRTVLAGLPERRRESPADEDFLG